MNTVDNYKVIEQITSGEYGIIYKVQNVAEEIPSLISPLMNQLQNNELFQNVIYKHFWGSDTLRQGEQLRGERGRIPLTLKVLESETPFPEDFVENFQQYFAKAVDFNHDNIIDVHHVGFIDGKTYYVMEYVNGVSIQKEISTCGAYFEPTACRIVYQTSQALDYLHERNIVHCGVHSGSIILSNNNKPKLHTKLHRAAFRDRWGIKDEANRSPIIKDIRDLAIVFYEMLTGEIAEEKIDVGGVDASEGAKEVLQKMLSSYSNCQEICSELQEKDLLSVKF
ncbi:protein kinase [Candidatus Uabimicrobium sp. HlEnr_7]|uniref:protein kinase domain-containing protein n=1 Tax=Candidatus Uabimicrobium helgolandensis TaxID=3095367 RepID=UPI0035573364